MEKTPEFSDTFLVKVLATRDVGLILNNILLLVDR